MRSFLKVVNKTGWDRTRFSKGVGVLKKGDVSETCWTTDHKTLCHNGVLGLLKDTKLTQMSRANQEHTADDISVFGSNLGYRAKPNFSSISGCCIHVLLFKGHNTFW